MLNISNLFNKILQSNISKLHLFIVIALLLSVAFFAIFSPYHSVWKIWNLPVGTEHFYDMRQMMYASESYALGFNPLYENPEHPDSKPLNYPTIWHNLFVFGMNESHTDLLGGIFAVLFFIGIGIFLFSKKQSLLTVFIVSLVVLSPAVMLGIERGNIEVVMFFILSVALFAGYYSSILACFVIIFASFLKLYPVFAFFLFLKENKRKYWLLFISALTIFIVYMVVEWEDLRQVFITSTKNAKISYGLDVFWMGLTHPRILNLQLSDNIIMFFRVSSYILLVSIFIGMLFLSLKRYTDHRFLQGEHIDAFRIGACIYIGCFLLGANYDYRLTFLIFTIPQLVSWLNSEEKIDARLPLVILFAVVFSCWNYGIKRFAGMKLGFLMEELSNWILLSGLLYLFLASMPDYLRRPLSKIINFDRHTIADR